MVARGKKMSNPLDLYTGKKYDKQGRKCTREFKNAWKDFVRRIHQIQTEFKDVGCDDSASREQQVTWVEKHAGDVM